MRSFLSWGCLALLSPSSAISLSSAFFPSLLCLLSLRPSSPPLQPRQRIPRVAADYIRLTRKDDYALSRTRSLPPCRQATSPSMSRASFGGGSHCTRWAGTARRARRSGLPTGASLRPTKRDEM